MYIVGSMDGDVEMFFTKFGHKSSDIANVYVFNNVNDAEIASKMLDFHNDTPDPVFYRKLTDEEIKSINIKD